MMKTITWITADYMLQVDLPILHKLKDIYTIRWIVYTSETSDKKKTALEYAHKYGIDITFYCIKGHRYSPLTYWEYDQQMKAISKRNSDVYYFDIIAFPYLLFAIKKNISHNKVIMAMHHGHIHNGMQMRYIYKYYLSYLCKHSCSFQYDSQTQANYFAGDSKRCFVIPLALNDFGSSNSYPPENYVQFLSFGNIIPTKNIELLIHAACKVREMIDHPFKIKIVGHCRNWNNVYQPLIKYPDIFDLHIESVPDKDIPILFSSSHFLVLPYKSVTQSGPLRIAYGYNLPVIASDLEGFKESIVDGSTGLLFKTESVDSLANILISVIMNHPNNYNEIREKQRKYIENNISQEVIISQYIRMFNSLLQ